MWAAGQVDAALQPESATDRLDLRMMATAGGEQVIEVEHEVWALLDGLEVVDIETRRAVAADQAGDGTAVTVADARLLSGSAPLGRVVEGVLVHQVSPEQCNQRSRMTNAYTSCTSPGSDAKYGIDGFRFWKTPAMRGECPGRRITTIRMA